MNNQFATQFLREEVDPNWLKNYMKKLGADEELVQFTLILIEKGLITPERALEIMKQSLGLNEDGAAGGAGGAAVGGGSSTTGGGVTNGASFAPGNGEQYAAGTRKKKYQENFELDPLKVGDRIEVTYGSEFYGHQGTVKGIKGGFIIVNIDDFDGMHSMHASDVRKIDDEVDSFYDDNYFEEDAPRLAGSPAKTNKQGAKNLSAYSSAGFTKAPSAEAAAKQIKGVDVKELWEGSVPDNVAKFAKRKGISSMVNKIAGWAEKAGKKVTGGTAIGKNYDTLILDLGYQDSAIRIEIPEGTVTVYDQPVRDFNSFVTALKQEGEELNESRAYSKFRKEATMRPKSEQLHHAAKMIHNRLAEITKLLEFTSQMKGELSEGEENSTYKHNTKKVFEKINSQVIEVYSKVKGLK
jgi:hypothetical protein